MSENQQYPDPHSGTGDEIPPHCGKTGEWPTSTAYPRPETTPGIFLEHFDLAEPLEDGTEAICYGYVYQNTKEVAASCGWGFRSYSSRETPGTRADYISRNVRSFPMLILYRDGKELGRLIISLASVSDLRDWARRLLVLK